MNRLMKEVWMTDQKSNRHFFLLFFMVKNTILAIELNRKERKGDIIFLTAMNGL